MKILSIERFQSTWIFGIWALWHVSFHSGKGVTRTLPTKILLHWQLTNKMQLFDYPCQLKCYLSACSKRGSEEGRSQKTAPTTRESTQARSKWEIHWQRLEGCEYTVCLLQQSDNHSNVLLMSVSYADGGGFCPLPPPKTINKYDKHLTSF